MHRNSHFGVKSFFSFCVSFETDKKMFCKDMVVPGNHNFAYCCPFSHHSFFSCISSFFSKAACSIAFSPLVSQIKPNLTPYRSFFTPPPHESAPRTLASTSLAAASDLQFSNPLGVLSVFRTWSNIRLWARDFISMASQLSQLWHNIQGYF